MTPCKWEDSVRIHERKDAGVRRLEDLRIRSKDRCKWGLLCHSHPFEGISRSRRQLRLHLYPAVCWILRVMFLISFALNWILAICIHLRSHSTCLEIGQL